MAVKITYKCDICNDDTNTGQLFGVVFSNLTEFTLGGYAVRKERTFVIDVLSNLKSI